MDPGHLDAVTVAFELAALEQLVAPKTVFEQTAGWASHVGVLSDRPTHVITEFARRHRLDLGFHSGSRTLIESLGRVRAQPELVADRYVVIGTDAVDDDAVRQARWEFLDVEDAAAAAGWRIRDESGHDDDTSWL